MNRNIVFAAFFSIILNMAIGAVVLIVVDIDGNSIFKQEDMGYTEYNEDMGESFIDDMPGGLNPGEVEDTASGQRFGLIDIIGLGWISKFVNVMWEFIHSFVSVMDTMFRAHMTDDLAKYLFGPLNMRIGVLYFVSTLAYIIVLFELFSNRRLSG